MWIREACAEVLAIVQKVGIQEFRVTDMGGSSWNVKRDHLTTTVNDIQNRYVMYRVYVEDYKVWLEILVDI